MKKTYIQLLETMLEIIDIRLDDDLIDLRFEVKQMLLTIKRQKTRVTKKQVNYITDLHYKLKDK